MTAPLCLIAAGGTGGHMFPAQAFAETLLRRGWRVTLSTDARGARYTQGFPEEVEIAEVASATFARGGLRARWSVLPRIAGGVVQTVRALRRDPPALVAGFGGYPSIPAMAAALLLRRPTLIHEQNGVLGTVNRRLARRVGAVACGTWPTDLPKDVFGLHLGNPVRAAIHARAGAPYTPPGDHPMSLLVIGGSQGARILSRTVPPAIDALPEPLRGNLRVAHQARGEDEARVAAYYAERGIAAEVAPFFPDVARRIDEAQLVVSRAGASSIADLTVIGRPSVLVPFAAAAGDHQSANARALAEAEAAVVIPEARLTPAALAANMEAILSQPDAASHMARRALELGRPNAAEALADLGERIAGVDKHGAEDE